MSSSARGKGAEGTQTPAEANSSAGTGPATPKASEALLTQLITEAYATEYPDRGARVRISRRWWVASIVVSAIATLAITAALSSTRLLAPQRAQQRTELSQRLLVTQRQLDALASQNSRLRREIRQLSIAGLNGSGTGRDVLAALEAMSIKAGLTTISGPGMCVEIRKPVAGAGPTDRDIQQLANALWQRGARGIAINGFRLTSRSAIRTAGEAILVSYRPLAWPYVTCALDAGAPRPSLQPASIQPLLDEFMHRYRVESRAVRSSVLLPPARLPE